MSRRAIEVGLQQRRDAKQNQLPAKQVVLPHLWILSPTVSDAVLEGFGARQTEQWGQGVYVLPESLQTAIVVLHQLPTTLDTLVLRLLGRGAVQNQAIAELLALSMAESFRKVCLHHLAKLQLTMKTRQKLSKDDRELIDSLQPAYDEWERETIEKGRKSREAELLSRTVPVLLDAGLSIDQIAQQLQVGAEAVRQAAQQSQN